MANPVAQFVIEKKIPFEMGGVDLSFTNSAVWMSVAIVVSVLFLSIAMKTKEMALSTKLVLVASS